MRLVERKYANKLFKLCFPATEDCIEPETFHFFYRATLCVSAVSASCLPVRPSRSCIVYIQTAKDIVKLFSQSDRPISLLLKHAVFEAPQHPQMRGGRRV